MQWFPASGMSKINTGQSPLFALLSVDSRHMYVDNVMLSTLLLQYYHTLVCVASMIHASKLTWTLKRRLPLVMKGAVVLCLLETS